MFPGKAVSFLPFFTVITSSRFFRETKVHSQLDGQPETVKGISLIIIICNNIVIFFKEAVIAVMALIRLSTTTHNLLTFNISEISSNNSEKNTSGLFSYTRLIQVPGCRVTRSADHLSLVFTPEKNDVLARVKVHLQFCSHLIHLTPKSLFPRPKT